MKKRIFKLFKGINVATVFSHPDGRLLMKVNPSRRGLGLLKSSQYNTFDVNTNKPAVMLKEQVTCYMMWFDLADSQWKQLYKGEDE